MRAHVRFTFFSLIMLLLLVVSPISAQDTNVCTPFIEQALDAVGTNCGGLGRNSVCYGFNRVDATFTQAMAEDFFSTPADQAGLVELQNIRTVPLSVDLNQWGVAVMSVQANVPGTLPGQAVNFLLLGDGTLENAVPPEEANTTVADPVEVTVATNANIRSGPSSAANVIGGAEAGTTLMTDGVSADLSWLRVLHNGAPAWISRSVLGETSSLDTLQVINETQRSPMQAFYFRTGTGEPSCAGMPPATLVVQGPQRVTVDLSVNGAEFSLGSTVAFTQSGNTLTVYVLDGTFDPATGNPVPAGYVLEGLLDDDGSFTGVWTTFRAMTPEEIASLQWLELIPIELLNYPIVLPDLTQTQTVQGGGGGGGGGGGTQQQQNPPPTEEAAPPPDFNPNDIYVEFRADPDPILVGGCSTISWNTRNVREVWFEGQPNIGTNSVERCPTETGYYTLWVFYYDGTMSTHTIAIHVEGQDDGEPDEPVATDEPPSTEEPPDCEEETYSSEEDPCEPPCDVGGSVGDVALEDPCEPPPDCDVFESSASLPPECDEVGA